jgi:outer membrane protein assembly factor BamB
MKKTLYCIILVFLLISTVSSQVPKWAVELDEPIKEYNFINGGKYLFFTNGPYLWCYDAASGNKIWETEVSDFEESGMHSLVGDIYLVGTEDNLICYDAVSGKLKWQQSYNNIDQSDYTSFEFVKNTAVIRYGDFEVAIDLDSGKELWRMEIDYWGDLVEKGSFNYMVLEEQNKMMVLEDSEILSLFYIKTGEKLYTAEGFDINTDLIASNNSWLYTTPDQSHLLFILENGAVLIDAVNNKQIAKKEFDIDGDMNVLLPTANGCAVMGEDKFVHFNFKNGKVDELDFPIDDIRTMHAIDVNGKSLLMLSLDSRMAVVDLENAKILWQTKEDDPEFDGYAHRYLKQIGEDVVLTYNRIKTFGDDRGTHLYVEKINALTGKVSYKTEVLQSQIVMAGFVRTLTNIVGGVVTGIGDAMAHGTAEQQQAIDAFNNISGYQNIGFEYETMEHGDNLIVVCRTIAEMWNPSTDDEPGEGVVSLDINTGKINYADYFEVATDMDQNQLDLLAVPAIYGDDLFIPGENRLIGFDLKSGKRLWTLNQDDELVTELAVIDEVLYAKFGKEYYDIRLDQNEIKVDKTVNEDPFGFHAIDPASGNVFWTVTTESDPGLVTPQFSITNYYNADDNRLYFSDEKNVYALKMGKNGGKFDWTINLDDAGLGEMEYENSYAVKEQWLGSRIKTTTTYHSTGAITSNTTGTGIIGDKAADFLEDAEGSELWSTYTTYNNIWGATAKRCLRVLYGGDLLLVVGPEAVALIDAANGEKLWSNEWDYDQDNVGYIPKIIGDKIVSCCDEKLCLLNLATGKVVWQAEESDKSKFFISPDKNFFFSLNEENIKGYSLD